jgi:hypothetical protein
VDEGQYGASRQYGKRSTRWGRSSWEGSGVVESARAGVGGRETGVMAQIRAGGAGAGDADAIFGEGAAWKAGGERQEGTAAALGQDGTSARS